MKIISIIFVILISMTSFAANDKTCKSLPDSASDLITFELRGGNFLNKENWNQFDVIFHFDYESCKKYTSQSLIKYNNQFMWVVRTLEDSCDGGNTYGAIYNYQRTQAIAHISDGDILCSNDWSEDDIAPKY